MSKKERREMSTEKGRRRRSHLRGHLDSHIKTLEETFQILETPAESSLDKTNWTEVIKIGDEISKQATITGMLWNGEARELKELEESMGAYFNLLHGFLLLCHGSSVGAGPTLHAGIRCSAKQVMDCSLSLLREAVSSYGSSNSSKRLTVPQLTGSVWEACDALKKRPTTNCSAVVRAITQVAVSVKDVLREMRELKPTAAAIGSDGEEDANPDGIDDGSSDDGLGDDLSPEEMNIARLIIDVASSSLNALKEIIRFILSSSKLNSEDSIDSLERLLGYCQEIGSQVNELGASVYPPQEFSEMNAAAEKTGFTVTAIRREAESMESSKEREKLSAALGELDSSLERLKSGLVGDLVPQVYTLVLQ